MKQKRYYSMIVLGIVLAGFGAYLLMAQSEPDGFVKTVPYLCIGIGCGVFGHGLGEVLSRKAQQKHPELAKQIRIDQKDERNITHANASKAKGYDMAVYAYGALLLLYAFLGAELSIVLSLAGVYLLIQFFTLYQRLRLDREQ